MNLKTIVLSTAFALSGRAALAHPCGTRLSRWSHRTPRISTNRMHPVLQVCTQRTGCGDWL